MRTLHQNFIWGLDGTLQSMLVENGRVMARGVDLAAVAEAELVDHHGQSLIPLFNDAHCHILPTGLDLQKLHLGSANSHEEVLELVSKRLETVERGWLHAVHYDQNRYSGGHLNLAQLDQISNEVPILLRHVNGHAGVANSAALRAAGITSETPDPEGGSFERDESGALTGVLFELALEQVSLASPGPNLNEMVEAILLAGTSMRSKNISSATDMMTGYFDLDMELQAYRIAAERGCEIDTRLFLQWKTVFGRRALSSQRLLELSSALEKTGRSRICGVKIFADGAIGSATAAIYGTYTLATPSGPILSSSSQPAVHAEREVSGQLIYRPERLRDMVLTAHGAGYQVATHTIGDYSTDLVLDAYEATGEPGRHRLEHAMILDDAQISRIAQLGCPVTFQPEFLLRFGHAYLRQLGPERARELKRARSLIDAGVSLSFSSDRPIVAGDPVDGINAAVARPEGFDPAENISLAEAYRAYTVEAARLHGDEGEFGTLEPGTRAEFQVIPVP